MIEQSLIPQAPALPLTAQRTVKRALTLLDRHLRETGVAFTSTQAARDWLKLKMAGLEREEFSKRAARTVLTGMCYSVGSATRQGSSSPTRFIGQSAMTSRT